jgi:hypothetical protein
MSSSTDFTSDSPLTTSRSGAAVKSDIGEKSLSGSYASLLLRWGVLAPAATPRPVVQKLHADIAEGLRSEKLKSQFEKNGAEAIGDTPEQFAATLKAEHDNWGRIVKEAGIRIE